MTVNSPSHEPLPEDPLALRGSSRDPSKSYQWFRFPNEDFPYRNPTATGWEAVTLSEMPEESSSDEVFIQRGAVRLFWRPKEITDAAISQEIEAAQADLAKVDAYRVGYLPDGTPVRPGMIPARAPSGPLENRPKPRSGYYHVKNRRMYICFEEDCRKSVFSAANRFPRALLRMNIVLLTKEEADIAHYCRSPCEEYAFHKIDLIRDGLISARLLKARKYRSPSLRPIQVNIYIGIVPIRNMFASLRARCAKVITCAKNLVRRIKG
jgi:hypothetical protein